MSVCMGEKILVKLYAPIDGAKQIIGTLDGYDEESITVDEKVIPRKAIAKMNVYFQF